jgi:hypothetical protein
MLGGVASYGNESVFAAEMLPALSVHVPLTAAELESGPAYVGVVHEAMPDKLSVP